MPFMPGEWLAGWKRKALAAFLPSNLAVDVPQIRRTAVEITEVRVKLMEEPGERLQAFCSITFDDAFVVRDLKIIEGATGPFVAMPSRKLTAHCPQCGCKNHLRSAYCNQCGARLKEPPTVKDEEGRAKLYADIAHPINSACREMIQVKVIQAFEEEKSRSKLPGYAPTYEDYDVGEFEASSRSSAVPAMHSAHVQGAERPQGPHRVPSQHNFNHAPQTPVNGQAAKPPESKSFGAGVFE
jgi:stage V sporulation protein G